MMSGRVRALVCVALVVAGAPTAFAQAPSQAAEPAAAATLAVAGDVRTPMAFSPADLKAMPRTRAVINDEGRKVTYEGVLVGELLKRVGAPLGAELRGDAMASYVLASAADGYRVLFSLAELDPAFTANDVIVADTIDGKPLFGFQGPWRIVAPKDARGARSIRMLQRLEVVRLRK